MRQLTITLIGTCLILFCTLFVPNITQAQGALPDGWVDDGIPQEAFDAVNPLVIEQSSQAHQLSTPGGIVSRALDFAFPIAGMVLFVMLVWGGFEMLAGSFGGEQSLNAGKSRATAALVGFLLLFCSYWLMQIIQYVFGIVIL
ncbi:MAG: hypothetical protein H6774_01935 [Pseudomonadales bacterium]|nr:hypothetical protein [Candidatus Woesebacteria bacterium]MCB9801826.1 hypothetical protein [Pseudomonadales bacterium]